MKNKKIIWILSLGLVVLIAGAAVLYNALADQVERDTLAAAPTPPPQTETDEEAIALPLRVIVPAFMTCELKQAFIIGFCLYLPFMLIDIVVSCTLMSMGMVMLPPAMISMPFKLLLFIAVDGWQMLFSTLIRSFNG